MNNCFLNYVTYRENNKCTFEEITQGKQGIVFAETNKNFVPRTSFFQLLLSHRQVVTVSQTITIYFGYAVSKYWVS